MSKTSCALRCSRRSVQRALRAPAEGEGGGGVLDIIMRKSVRGNACVLPQHVQCESARRASATGAPYPQARPTPRTLDALCPHFERALAAARRWRGAS